MEKYQELFIDSNWKEFLRTKCEVWTRVMGYARPISMYNHWKKSEYYSRTNFKEETTMNSKFIKDFL